ncbi:MAG: hypothetical protein FWC00_02750 [Firmicutes bacterium]|nr:hypothetical protein [Bacillota bacterium]
MKKTLINVFNFKSDNVGDLSVISWENHPRPAEVQDWTRAFVTPIFDDPEYAEWIVSRKNPDGWWNWPLGEKDVFAKAIMTTNYTKNKDFICLEAITTNPRFKRHGLAEDLVRFCASLVDGKKYKEMQLEKCMDLDGYYIARTKFSENSVSKKQG